MKTKMNNKSTQALAALVLASGLASQAKADILQDYNISAGAGYGTTVSWTLDGSSNSGEGGFIGGINISAAGGLTTAAAAAGMPASYTTVCTDLGYNMSSGPYAYEFPINDTDGSLHTPNPSQVGSLTGAESIFAANVGSIGNADSAAALQLAVWTELYNNGNKVSTTLTSGTLAIDFGSYNITATGMNSTVQSELLTMLGDTGNPTPNMEQLVPDTDSSTIPQGLLYTPVPEASTVIAASTLLLSFGVCSLKSFSKKRA